LNDWLYYEFLLSALQADETIPYPGQWTDHYMEELDSCHLINIHRWSGRIEIYITPAGERVLAALREPDFPERCAQNTSLPEVYQIVIDRPCVIKQPK
jgi:hypothetical protein